MAQLSISPVIYKNQMSDPYNIQSNQKWLEKTMD